MGWFTDKQVDKQSDLVHEQRVNPQNYDKAQIKADHAKLADMHHKRAQGHRPPRGHSDN
jgi:hypothetical protein